MSGNLDDAGLAKIALDSLVSVSVMEDVVKIVFEEVEPVPKGELTCISSTANTQMALQSKKFLARVMETR